MMGYPSPRGHRPRKTFERTDVEAAFVAGLFEGEGSAGVTVTHPKDYRTKKRYTTRLPWIYIYNNDESLLLWCKERIGGGVYRRAPTGWGKKTGYSWRVCYNLAYQLAKRILPYIVTERSREKLIRIIERYEPKEGE